MCQQPGENDQCIGNVTSKKSFVTLEHVLVASGRRGAGSKRASLREWMEVGFPVVESSPDASSAGSRLHIRPHGSA